MRTPEEIAKEYHDWAGKVAAWETALAHRAPVKVVKAEIRAAQKRMAELKTEAADALLGA